MSTGDTPITIIGNLVQDPELRYTPSGAAVANFRIASTPRRYNSQTNQWEDAEGLFLTCNVWREQAESVAESIQKGMRVIVNGVSASVPMRRTRVRSAPCTRWRSTTWAPHSSGPQRAWSA